MVEVNARRCVGERFFGMWCAGMVEGGRKGGGGAEAFCRKGSGEKVEVLRVQVVLLDDTPQFFEIQVSRGTVVHSATGSSISLG